MNPLERARINTRRELVQKGYGPLYDKLQQILLKHNPAKLDPERGDMRDDYGLPVGTLIPKLKSTDQSRLKHVLHREMSHWYRDEAGTPDRYDEIAREMWAEWAAFEQSPKSPAP
jgi:hypothetical protein